MKRRLSAVAAGVAAAMLPVVTFAQEHGDGATFEAHSRATEPGADWAVVMLVTAIATLGPFLLAAIGYGYRRVRGLEWPFQRPDAPHADHGAH